MLEGGGWLVSTMKSNEISDQKGNRAEENRRNDEENEPWQGDHRRRIDEKRRIRTN